MTTTKTTLKTRELVDRYQENCDRILAIADACEREGRGRNEQETKEYEQIVRENGILEMKIRGIAAEHMRENPDAKFEAERVIRENARAGKQTEIVFVRDMMMVGDVEKGGLIPLNVQTIMGPLEEGFLLDKVGLPMPTGLVGEFVWPMYETVDAELAGEGVELTDKKISFSKMTATPERMGVAVQATRQSLYQSNGLVERIIREVMPRAIRRLLNKIILGRVKANETTNLAGPFVAASAKPVTLSETPTFKELNVMMKAAVLATGIDGETLCWTMTKAMEAVLEGTPINEKGIFIPMVQNHMLCGLPVYTSNEMRDEDGTENIGLGDWRYQPMGLFNTFRFTVDPYSKSRKDCVDFVLNCDYATKTLREEAFLLGKVAKAASSGTGTSGKPSEGTESGGKS